MLVRSKNPSEVVAVLIDTWWNVNMRAIYLPTDQRIVLIDTWWNVNMV